MHRGRLALAAVRPDRRQYDAHGARHRIRGGISYSGTRGIVRGRSAHVGAGRADNGVILSRDQDNFALTASLTARPSAFFPARWAIAAFMTLPMSFIEEAPVSATAASTAAAISSSEAACGK